MKHIPCCDCGTALLSSDTDAETKLNLCVDCWRKQDSATIIARSYEHDKISHAHDPLYVHRVAKAAGVAPFDPIHWGVRG